MRKIRQSRKPLDIDLDVAFAVRLTRKANCLKQSELAAKMRVPRSYISRVERYQVLPTINTLARLAKALGASTCALVTIASVKCDEA